ncbi:MAG: UTP--glucose-1-phosphate uridylyltransferase GalU [Patescibacteria group bacterium]
MSKIRKAIIPVAGLGTRFLPATKAQPKEMLTLVDKPVIQYIVEEAVAAGIEQIVFVTSQNKRAIEDHFDRNFELEYRLREKKKLRELAEVEAISNLAQFVYIRQKTPLGDGHAVLAARSLIGDEPCAVLFGDDVIDAQKPCIGQMIKVFQKYNDPVVAVEKVRKSEVSRYGVVGGTSVERRVLQVKRMVEKPAPEHAPSNLAIVGRYIITPEVFEKLAKQKPGKDGEIRLISALEALLTERSVYAYEFEGKRYDCGNRIQFLLATIDLGLKHPELSGDIRKHLRALRSGRAARS